VQIPVCRDDRRFVCTAKNASTCLRATVAPIAGKAMFALSNLKIPVSWLKRVLRGMACWRMCSARTISPSSPPGVATSSLRFATLGGKYPRPDFHRLDGRHARHTKKERHQTVPLPAKHPIEVRVTRLLCCYPPVGTSKIIVPQDNDGCQGARQLSFRDAGHKKPVKTDFLPAINGRSFSLRRLEKRYASYSACSNLKGSLFCSCIHSFSETTIWRLTLSG